MRSRAAGNQRSAIGSQLASWGRLQPASEFHHRDTETQRNTKSISCGLLGLCGLSILKDDEAASLLPAAFLVFLLCGLLGLCGLSILKDDEAESTLPAAFLVFLLCVSVSLWLKPRLPRFNPSPQEVRYAR
jgi:hypothetical protein